MGEVCIIWPLGAIVARLPPEQKFICLIRVGALGLAQLTFLLSVGTSLHKWLSPTWLFQVVGSACFWMFQVFVESGFRQTSKHFPTKAVSSLNLSKCAYGLTDFSRDPSHGILQCLFMTASKTFSQVELVLRSVVLRPDRALEQKTYGWP